MFFYFVFPVQGNFTSLVGDPGAKVLHIQSAEQCGGNQPRTGECVYQRRLGAGDTGRDVFNNTEKDWVSHRDELFLAESIIIIKLT